MSCVKNDMCQRDMADTEGWKVKQAVPILRIRIKTRICEHEYFVSVKK